MNPTVLHAPAFEDNYIWFVASGDKIGNDNERPCIIIDPGDADAALSGMRKRSLRPVAIFCTHLHGDHVDGAQELAARFDASVYGPGNEPIRAVTNPVNGGETIEMGELGVFRVLDTPGHTAGHISYLGGNALFCGDTLFSGGCGRLFDGTAEQLFDSLKMLAALPGDTRVYCAHEYTLSNLAFALAVEPENLAISALTEQCKNKRQKNEPTIPSTIALEKDVNPFLRTSMQSVKTSAESFANRQLNTELEVFTALRKWKDGFTG